MREWRELGAGPNFYIQRAADVGLAGWRVSMSGAAMNRERWRQVEVFYHADLEQQPSDREAYLAQTCPDEELRREVESLLAESSSGGLLDKQAWEAVVTCTDTRAVCN